MGRVAVVVRGRLSPRLVPVVETLAADVVEYDEQAQASVRRRLVGCGAVLVWVDPVSDGRDRSGLDTLLSEISAGGTWVSAHPDTILRMGTKEVLWTTRTLGWGTDVRLYRTRAELAAGLARSLESGPRVLKQYRGNGGIGVWKAELVGPGLVRIQGAHGRSGDTELIPLSDFVDRSARYLDYTGGRLVDQPFQTRVAEGMVRCYVVGRRVVGFARQHAEASAGPVFGLPSSKTMLPPDDPALASLRRSLEESWIDGMLELTGVVEDRLPALWDADFLLGDSGGHVLCEINCSCVTPFPPETIQALAALVARRLEASP